VARWQLLGGPVRAALAPLATVSRTGFETTLSTPVGVDYIAVRALASDGSVLGTSPTIAVGAAAQVSAAGSPAGWPRLTKSSGRRRSAG
jgi:RIO-like serine/threonine protein kinase